MKIATFIAMAINLPFVMAAGLAFVAQVLPVYVAKGEMWFWPFFGLSMLWLLSMEFLLLLQLHEKWVAWGRNSLRER